MSVTSSVVFRPRAFICVTAFFTVTTSGRLPGSLVYAMGWRVLIEYSERNLMVLRPSPALLKPYRASI